MQMTSDQAQVVGKYFELSSDETIWLTTVPYRNNASEQAQQRSDPIIHRFHEVSCNTKNKKKKRERDNNLVEFNKQALGIYGPALKEILHEDFGDGVMSAIDMSVKLENIDGRVQITWNGKFLPYKKP